jgi:hypothetical protein
MSSAPTSKKRKRIREALARYRLSYHSGGMILGAATALPTKSLNQILKARDLAEVDKEFERALANVEADSTGINYCGLFYSRITVQGLYRGQCA